MIAAYLKDNNLIICPHSLQKNVITEINSISELISYKIMDVHTFLENYLFSYDKKTILYLMKKLHLKYEIIIEYLNSMYFIEDKEYQNPKLNELKALKTELLEQKLLIHHPAFHNYLKHTNIILYGYDFLDPFYEKIFSSFPNYVKVSIHTTPQKHTVYEFPYIDEEIAYVCHHIKEKLDQGIPIQNIKIITPSDEYFFPMKRIFSWCHIPLDLESKTSLYSIEVGKDLLNKIKANLSFSDIIESYLHDELDSDLLNQIITILNHYVDLEEESKNLYPMIEYDLKNTNLPTPSKINCVSICDWNQISSQDYVYVMGFNKENYPHLYKDIEFLSDAMKQELDLWDSNQKNIHSMKTLKNYLNQPFSFMITYKLKTAFDIYNPSILISEEGYSVVQNPSISFQISHFYNQMVLANQYDQFYKYGIIDKTMNMLGSNYPDLEYRTYKNQFTKLDHPELIASFKNPFTLSYSTIDEYYRCAFRYYISNILKIKEETGDEFYRNIGTIFHYILSKSFDDDFELDKEWDQEIRKYEFSLKQMVLLEKLKQELQYDIDIIRKQKTYSQFDQFLYEKKFTVPIENTQKFPVHFVGIVDKISYLKEPDQTLVSIIDYKTGNLPSNLNNIIYGIGMQLPIYLYFIKRSNLFPNVEVVGFYLQKIINKEMKKVPGKSIEELKENALKLVGYSIDQEELLEKLDITYEDSKLISGLKKKKEGFYAYSKVLNPKQIESMDYLVSKKIQEAVESILNGEFSINPKRIDKDIVGCEFCSYRDLCYKTEKDYIELEKHRNLDFLGGEENAKMDS